MKIVTESRIRHMATPDENDENVSLKVAMIENIFWTLPQISDFDEFSFEHNGRETKA